MRSEAAILIGAMEKSLKQKRYFLVSEFMKETPVSHKTISNKDVLAYRKKNRIISSRIGVYFYESDKEYIKSLRFTKPVIPVLTQEEAESEILSIKKEFNYSILEHLVKEKNFDTAVNALNRLISVGLVAKVPMMYMDSVLKSRVLYYVVGAPDLIGGMSVQDPKTREIDWIREVFLKFKRKDLPFSHQDMIIQMATDSRCYRHELRRLCEGGFVEYNKEIEKYEFIK